MPKIILSGKGGSGKSTLTSLLSQTLAAEGKRTLVVDTDESNRTLDKMLNMSSAEMGLLDYLGGREEFKANMGKDSKNLSSNNRITLDMLPEKIVSWKGNLGLLSVGKIQQVSEGCACPMGATARKFLNQLTVTEDEWVIVDTEAGVEHFGRGLLEGADKVVMVIEPSNESVTLAERIKEFAEEKDKPFVVVLNKIGDKQEKILTEKLEDKGIRIGGILKQSEGIALNNLMGETIDSSEFTETVNEILRTLV
ncbi:AAA family ATPase [Alkalibaculum bacchi]|uniref:ATP-binding protein n=1 Tax=Alkalibaculum bacchi TaxID=645887 RepID=UPI0026F017E6|nr:AAA family ATPase [Alkalibaculum bacchi]